MLELKLPANYEETSVIIWGAGQNGSWISQLFQQEQIEVIGFCDSDINKTKQEYCGLPVFSPEDLNQGGIFSKYGNLLIQISVDFSNIENGAKEQENLIEKIKSFGIKNIATNDNMYQVLRYFNFRKITNLSFSEINNRLTNFYDVLQDEKSKKILQIRVNTNFNDIQSASEGLSSLLEYSTPACQEYIKYSDNEKRKRFIMKYSDHMEVPIIFLGVDSYSLNIFQELVSDTDFYENNLVGRNIFFYDPEKNINLESFQGYPLVSAMDIKETYAENGIFVNLRDPLDNSLMNFRLYELLELCVIPYSRYLLVFWFPDEDEQYFDEEIIKLGDDEVFLDVGVFNAGTTSRFANRVNGNYEKIVLFEPNPSSYKVAQQRLQQESIENYELIPLGLWNEKDVLRFIGEGGAFGFYGNNTKEEYVEIPVDRLDDILNQERVTYIKMDIEGSELKALEGATETIIRNRPKLAISLYHKPEDLIQIYHYLSKIVPEYKFYLRHYSIGWAETVLYAVLG